MKKIETVIHPQQWEETQAVLRTLSVASVLRQVHTFGRTPPRHEVYRGLPYTLATAMGLELAFVVRDEVLESAVLALAAVIGDREILVSSVDGKGAGTKTARREPRPLRGCADASERRSRLPRGATRFIRVSHDVPLDEVALARSELANDRRAGAHDQQNAAAIADRRLRASLRRL